MTERAVIKRNILIMNSHNAPASNTEFELSDWYDELLAMYFDSWNGSREATIHLMEFIEKNKNQPDYLANICKFKNHIYRNSHPSYPRTHKNHLFFDCTFVSETPGFTTLNQCLDELINPYSSQSFYSFLIQAMTSMAEFVIKHPVQSLAIFCVISLPLTAAMQNNNQNHVDSSAPINDNNDLALCSKNSANTYSSISFFSCEKKLEALQKKSPKQLWPKVQADGRLPNSRSISKALVLCNEALKEILEEPGLFPNLLSLKNLKIILLPEDILFSEHSYGAFSLKHNQIGIAYKNYYTKANYKQALRNELFSHQVMEQNLKMQNPDYDSLQLKKSFSPKSLTIIMDETKHVISTYKKIIDRGIENLPEQEKSKLNPLLEVASEYEPKPHFLDPESFQTALKLDVVHKSGNFFESGSRHPASLPKAFGKKQNKQYIYQHCKLEDTSFNKLSCLINDLYMAFAAIENPEGPYSERSFSDKERELASFIAELPMSIQKILFPDFVTYMCEFFTEEPGGHISHRSNKH